MNIVQRIQSGLSTWIGKIGWKTKRVVAPEELAGIKQQLADNYFIILTRHHGYLSSYAIAFSHWVLSGFRDWGYYGHVLMNLEDTVKTDDDFRFIEATGRGVHYSGFDQVFDSQIGAVALLKPKCMSLDKWTAVMDRAKTELGKPYDTLFQLADDRALSCVELVRVALQSEPNYAVDFANFEKMIAEYNNLEPHMFYKCPDFTVVYEVRR